MRFKLFFYWFSLLFIFSVILFMTGLYFLFFDLSLFIDWELLSMNSVSFIMTLFIDSLSLIFMSSVLFISSMVVYYSFSYMMNDIFNVRFLYIVLLFVFSMMLLIVSPNLVSILLGWDGLGLVSYCLVIYFQNYKSFNAGMLTVMTNRIGDVAILISIAWIFNNGSFNFIKLFNVINVWVNWIVFLIILAAFTKSAQIPFSSWLPAAMAAPTPVSALVHSSTLVTAGVYLLIRFSYCLYLYNLYLFLFLSCLTMFMSGLAANFEYDLKSVIALSTLSQLGFMMSILFLGFPLLSYFHLLTHAFFSALLFLCAGLIIHSMNDSQDIRHMGMLMYQLPFTTSCFCISTFSLCGLPFLSGFYSKDLILDSLSLDNNFIFIYIIFYLSIGLTVSYSFRLIYYCFSVYSGLSVGLLLGDDNNMMFPMFMLTLMSIFSGSILSWMLISNPNLLMMPIECKLMPLFTILSGALLGYYSSYMGEPTLILGLISSLPIWFLSSMWFLPNFSTTMLNFNILYLSNLYTNFMDHGWGEYVISGSFSSFFSWMSKFNTIYQNNNIKIYLISFLLMGVFMITVL
nr:NADH dehydrogenase subunit 5 [Eumenotes sp. HEM140]